MKPILREGIKQSVKENFMAYPDDYPMQPHKLGYRPTEDSLLALKTHIEGSYENRTELEDEGTLEEWKEAAIEAFIEHFEITDQKFDDPGDMLTFIEEEVM